MPPTNNRFFVEPHRGLLTPSASPSVGPPDRPPAKRTRFRSTPSSSISVTPSTSNDLSSSVDVNSARRASTLRVLNTWAQLAERYSKPLDEDDIIDLHRFVIIKDRGVIEGASKDYHIGHFTQLDSDQDYPDADQDQEDSEQDDDDNELNTLPPSEAATDDDAPISKKELLRGVPPLSATTDAEDLKEFLEAEKMRRELAGDEEDEEDMSPEQLSALKKELHERLQRKEASNQARDVTSTEHALEHEVDSTPTRPSTRDPSPDNESEDELALWKHDESTAVYRVAQVESEQMEPEREVIELSDTDSDAEFEAILIHPPHFSRASTPSVPHPEEVQQPPESLSDSERGRPKSRMRPHSEVKPAGVMLQPENQPSSPLVPQKARVVLNKRKPSIPKETCITPPSDEKSDEEVSCNLLPHKGKGKETSRVVEDGRREKTLKSLGIASRGRKRKRISSSSVAGSPSTQSLAESKSVLRSHGKSPPQSSITLSPSNCPKPALDKDLSTPARLKPTVSGSSRSLSPFSSISKTQLTSLSLSPYQSFESNVVSLTPDGPNPSEPLLSDLPTPVTYPYSQRHPSHPPPIFPFPNQGTPGVPVPPLDPVQTQQAHYLLAQAMNQLSYLLSATMPAYGACAPSPGQSWQRLPPPLPLHTPYNTPIHPLPQTHHHHLPSSSVSRSGLPPSSPVRSSVTPVVEEQRARSRGRSKSRGRRVSFKLGNEGVADTLEHDAQPEHQNSGKKSRKPAFEVKREREKGKATEELDSSSRLEERESPPREVARGRTPGPPSCKKNGAPRGRSLSRR